MRSSPAWAKAVTAQVTLTVALTFSAPPCDAADASKAATPKTDATRSLSAAAAARVAATELPRGLAQDASTGASATGSARSFFRSRTGVAAIVLMVAGAGYVAYRIPKDNEKVHSPIR